LLQNYRVEVKDLMMCPYFGKEDGLLEVEYTWLDKKNDIVVHDKCFKEIKKKQSKK
jgi:hypothetical protein